MPKVTVLMAVYNGEAYLTECINSVLGQTYKDFEFLIIDDGSTDATAKIISSYGDDRIRVIKNGRNLSQVTSLNIGLEHSRGEYIARIDADDIMFPKRLEKQLDFLNRKTDVALVGTWGMAINANGGIIAKAKLPTRNAEIVAAILLGEFILVHSSMMFRKKVIFDIGKYNEDFSFTEDYKLATDLLLRGYRINNMPEPLVRYRLHNDRISVRDSKPQNERYLIALKQFIQNFTKDFQNSDFNLLFNFLINAGSMNREYWQSGISGEEIKKTIALSEVLLNNVSAYFEFSRPEQYFLKKVFFKRVLDFAYQGCAFKKDFSLGVYLYSCRNWFFIFGKPKLYLYPIYSGITNLGGRQ